MIKIHRWSPFILALALLAAVAFLIPGVLRASEADKVSEFGEKVAGTYLVTRDPAEGPSRILTIHADGNLSSIQSIQFSEGTGPEGFVGFSDQQGAWEKAGNQQIEATVLDFEYDLSDGTFLGTARAHYVAEVVACRYSEASSWARMVVSGASWAKSISFFQAGPQIQPLGFRNGTDTLWRDADS